MVWVLPQVIQVVLDHAIEQGWFTPKDRGTDRVRKWHGQMSANKYSGLTSMFCPACICLRVFDVQEER